MKIIEVTVKVAKVVGRTFRYYFNYLIYYSIMTMTCVAFVPYLIIRPRDLKAIQVAAGVCRLASKIIGIHWYIRGKEHLEKDRACVVIANHQTSVDILGLFHALPVMGNCSPVAKSSLFYLWPFGLMAWLGGVVFIDRSNSDKAKATLIKTLQPVKRDKTKLLMFAEGTRRNTGEIHNFKKGAFYTAVIGQLPIIPMVFSRYYFLSGEETRFDPGQIIITALPAISTEGLTPADIPELMERTRKQMIEVFNSVNAEIKSSVSTKSEPPLLTELPIELPLKSKI